MYVKPNIEARSRCQGKAVSIIYSECDSVALVIQHANANASYYIHICGLSGSTVFWTLSFKR